MPSNSEELRRLNSELLDRLASTDRIEESDAQRVLSLGKRVAAGDIFSRSEARAIMRFWASYLSFLGNPFPDIALPQSELPSAKGRVGVSNKGEPARIKVIGIGGGGSNAVGRMIAAGTHGVEFVVVNSDAQALEAIAAPEKLQIGRVVTMGLGAGGNPDIGRRSAEESREEIRHALEGSDMVFITAGLGGGTGTGAAPVVAGIARELGALTVAVVTTPFKFEGLRRGRVAEDGFIDLLDRVDTIIKIPNDQLFKATARKTTLQEAFLLVDNVLREGVQGITDIVTSPGLINVDFADLSAVMANAGQALIGIGQGEGERRALTAAQAAVGSPLLERTLHGATKLLINLTGDETLTLGEAHEAMAYLSDFCDQSNAEIFFGTVVDPSMQGSVRITVVATRFNPHVQDRNVFSGEPVRRGRNASEDQPKIEDFEADLPRFLARKQQGQKSDQ